MTSKNSLKCIQCDKECEKNECMTCSKTAYDGSERITCRKCCGVCFVCKRISCFRVCMDWWEPDPYSIYKDKVLPHPVKACCKCYNKEKWWSTPPLEEISKPPETIAERLERLENRVAELENQLDTGKRRRFN